MSPLTVTNGNLLLRDGALGTEQACCCNKCSGPCSTDVDCGEGCFCCGGQCEEVGCCCVDLLTNPGPKLYSSLGGIRITRKQCEECGFDFEDAGIRAFGTWIPGCTAENGDESEDCTTNDQRPYTLPGPGCDLVCEDDPCNSPTKEIWNDCIGCPEDANGFVDCGTFCIPVGTGPPNIPGYTPCGAWTLAAFALDDCIPCGTNPLP